MCSRCRRLAKTGDELRRLVRRVQARRKSAAGALSDTRGIKHAGPPTGRTVGITQEAMMTTTVTTPLQGSSPHRIRRSVIAALVGGALIASTALLVNRLVDDDSRPTAAPPVAAATGIPSGATAADVCTGGLGWACIPQLSSGVTAADVCTGGLGWACVFTPQS